MTKRIFVFSLLVAAAGFAGLIAPVIAQGDALEACRNVHGLQGFRAKTATEEERKAVKARIAYCVKKHSGTKKK